MPLNQGTWGRYKQQGNVGRELPIWQVGSRNFCCKLRAEEPNRVGKHQPHQRYDDTTKIPPNRPQNRWYARADGVVGYIHKFLHPVI